MDINACNRHVVQFFDQDSHLVEVVGRFLWEGLRTGESVLILTRQERAEQLVHYLRTQGSALVDEAMKQERLLILDAPLIMGRVVVNGHPDPARFAELAIPMIRELKARSPRQRLRLYGDIVGMLAELGNTPAALKLENLWHTRILENDPAIMAWCGYPIHPFLHPRKVDQFLAVCRAHTRSISGDAFTTRQALLLKVLEKLECCETLGEVLNATASATVPALGDFSILELQDDFGNLTRRLVRTAGDFDLREKLEAESWTFTRAGSAMDQLLSQGLPVFMPQVEFDKAALSAPDPELDRFMDAYAIRSVLIVPLIHQKRRLGSLGFFFRNGGRSHSLADLILSEDFSRHAAAMISHASELKKLRASLNEREQCLEEIARQLSQSPGAAADRALGLIRRLRGVPLTEEVSG